MAGAVRAAGVCACGGAYRVPVMRGTSVLALACADCGAPPRGYYVDVAGIRDSRGRAFPKRKIYVDPATNLRIVSYPHAEQILDGIRRDQAAGRLDITRWAPDLVGMHRLSKVGDEWTRGLRRDSGRGHAAQYERFLSRYIVPILADMDVREITGRDTEALKRRMQETPAGRNGALASPRTVQAVVVCLGALMRYCQRVGIVRDLPPLPTVTVPRTDKPWAMPAEQAAILAKIPEAYRPVFRVMVETGIRTGEAVALKVRDVEEGGIAVERALDQWGKVKETKTGAVLYKRISPELSAELLALCRGRFGEEWVFLSQSGSPYLSTYLSRVWKRGADAAGVPIGLRNATRHSRITRRKNELEKELSAMLADEAGHSSPKMTLRHYVQRTTPVSQRVPDAESAE